MNFLLTLGEKIGCHLYKSNPRKKLEKIRAIVAKNPEAIDFIVRLGDLLAKLNEKNEAMRAYEFAAHQYAKKNLFKQALAVNKLILRLDPTQGKAMKAIVELQARWVDMDCGLPAGMECFPPESQPSCPIPADRSI